MTRAQVVALVVGLGAVMVIIEFVRRQALRVKYAGLWLLVGVAIAVLGAAPGLLDQAADLLQVADPPNLLFFVAILVLLGVIIQLSLELSRVEERIRVLAEHVAMLELRADDTPTSDAAPVTDADPRSDADS